MGRYAAIAAAHWRQFLPAAYAGIENHSKFFKDLEDTATDQIVDLAESLRGPDPDDEPFAQRMARFAQARQTAEEIVMHEVILVPPENAAPDDEAEDDEGDELRDAVEAFYAARDEL